MKIVLFYDQTQAGAGGKERPDVPLAVEKGGIGSYSMYDKFIKEIGGTVIATMYCGNGYFFENEEDVKRKVTGLAKKLNADVILCGPCFNYHDYAKMSALTAEYVEANSDIKAVAMLSKENDDVVEEFKDKVKIIKMPKKGGTGLNESLSNMAKVIKAVHEGEAKETYETYLY